MPLPSFAVLTTGLTRDLAVGVEPAGGSRSVVIFAGAALAALLLVVGQLIASRRITRLEEAQENRQPLPLGDLDARLRTLEAGAASAGQAEWRQPADAQRLDGFAGELAELRARVEDLWRQLRQPNEIPTALAVLAPLPAQLDELRLELAEVSARVAELAAAPAAADEAPSGVPGESLQGGSDTVVVDRLDRELQEAAARLDDLTERVSAPSPAPGSAPPEVAALLPRVARLERLVHRLAQQVAVTRETTYFYAGPDTGSEDSRGAVFVDVFLIPSGALPALSTPDQSSDADHLLVRRTWGSAPRWDAESPWAVSNGSHPTPFDADVLATFSKRMVNQFFDPDWERETAFWLAAAPADVAELARRADTSLDAWHGVLFGRPFALDQSALPLVPASAEALSVIGEQLPLPGDPHFVGVKWLVQFFGVAADSESGALASACVKSLPHDLVAETIAESIRGALGDVLMPVGLRQVEVPQRPRTRGAALELEQLKADALRASRSDFSRVESSSESGH